MSYTNCIAMDCEMVGGPRGENMAARVTLVNEHRQVLLDQYIKPSQPVGDYRTEISGITPGDLHGADGLAAVRARVERMIGGRVLVGHSLDGDLTALGLSHPESRRRDLAQYRRFKNMNGGQPASLKFLAKKILNRNIQTGAHSSVEDAKTCMEIYQHYATASDW